MLEQTALNYAKLKLNVDIPDLDENWLDGYESAQQEAPEEANPFQIGSTEYQQWQEGWWAGFFNEEKLFNWDDRSDITVNTIINRIQQATITENTVPAPKINRRYVVISHIIQVVSAVMAFGICYQFADLLG